MENYRIFWIGKVRNLYKWRMVVDENQSIVFQGNGANGASLNYSFKAFEYDKSLIDFSFVQFSGTAAWCCPESYAVPPGKAWKIIGYSGSVKSGIYANGEWWLDENQSIVFQGNGANGSSLNYSFIALDTLNRKFMKYIFIIFFFNFFFTISSNSNRF